MRFAYFDVPHIGGTYTVYRNLRDGLARHGITVRWVGLGPGAVRALNAPEWADERACGAAIAGDTEDERAQAEAFVRYVETAGFDGVFVNVLANRVQTNAVRYLDRAVLRIMIVHNITPGTYAAARAIRDHVHAAVGVSPRIRDDLVRRLGFAPARAHAVHNAPMIAGAATLQDGGIGPAGGGRPLRLVVLGRVEDASKGVFWLPGIMSHLADVPVALTVAGDGPDLAALRERCAPLAGRVHLIGRVRPEAVADILRQHDVLLFPSRYEGFSLSLVEAMATGCVPVATNIRGVTDVIVTHGQDGFLFPIGKLRTAAGMIRTLAGDRTLLAQMSAAARRTAAERFSLEAMAAGYAAILGQVRTAPPSVAPPLPLARWTYPLGLRAGLRTYLPTPIKNALRGAIARLSSA